MRKALWLGALITFVAATTHLDAQSRRRSSESTTRTPTYSLPPLPTYVPPPVYTPPPPPRSGSTYDWQSGNLYNWRKSTDGSTRVNGSNLQTGSMWNTTIKPNGSMTGTDSGGNYWMYNSGSKTYINVGTGTLCVGEGATRVCS